MARTVMMTTKTSAGPRSCKKIFMPSPCAQEQTQAGYQLSWLRKTAS